MSTILLTILLAFLVVAVTVSCLAIGWLLKGNSLQLRGLCVRIPCKKSDERDDVKK